MALKARLLDMGTVSPLRSQSIFHALTACMQPHSDIAVSLMRPNSQYVSIGYFQEAGVEVDLEYCRAQGLPVYRRHVGGGAVLLDGGQLFFHIMLPQARTGDIGLPHGLVQRFAYLAGPAIEAYRKLGVEATFRPINDIHVRGKKIGGTGVGEIEEGLVFAGSMMLDFDTAMMAKVLKVPDEKMRDKIADTLGNYMTTLKKELGAAPPLDTVAGAIVSSIEEAFDLSLEPSLPTPEELEAMYEWDRRLSDEDWLHLIRLREHPLREVKISASVRILHAAHKAPGGMIRATVRVVDGKIDELLLSGDFPVSPMSALEELAAQFAGARLDQAELLDRIGQAFAGAGFELAGVTAGDFQTLFQQIAP